ncbi:MAG: alanine racemase [Candidatus Saganbacteria bacterium]|nr:alanine racemase [Candidatus Saganbacteria bacterium]
MMEPFRPTCAEIDLKKLHRNIDEMRGILSPSTKFMAIVKANAYGHGAVEVSKAAEKARVDYLGVATLGEALELRSAYIKTPILILSETPAAYLERLLDAGLTQTVYTFHQAQALSDIAGQKKKTAKIHIKLDTGMGRVGMLLNDAVATAVRISSLPNIFIEGIFTHFSKADDPGSPFTAKQFGSFMKTVGLLKKEGIDPPIKHAANSAAALFFPETHLDMVRIGICMYGLFPSSKRLKRPWLQPVLSFKTKVLYLKEVEKGTPLSYGAAYRTTKRTKIATLPVGYADGLSRGLSGKGSVIIRGKKRPIVGNVTMDMTLIDADNDKIEMGDDAVIIGSQGKQTITADEIARLDGTINYEVICGIGKRVPRVYIR